MSGWTARDVPDQTGRTAVVTGANSGIGYVTAAVLAGRGARVVLGCRDEARGEQARRRILDRAAGPVDVGRLDLADLGSVRGFAERVLADVGTVDLLVNNAGVMAIPYARTGDGFEMQFGTNHLGHFALTGELLPGLLARPAARVVTVSSTAHRMGRIDFADLQSERRYRKWSAYGQSKLANLLFAFELQRRADDAGCQLLSVAAHPGFAATNLQLRGPRLAGSRLGQLGATVANRLIAQRPEMGALPTLYAATAPDVVGGEYFGPNGPFEARGFPQRVGTAPVARNAALGARLWVESTELTGVTYEFAC